MESISSRLQAHLLLYAHVLLLSLLLQIQIEAWGEMSLDLMRVAFTAAMTCIVQSLLQSRHACYNMKVGGVNYNEQLRP